MKAAIIQLEVNDNQTKKDRMSRVEDILTGIKEGSKQPNLIMLPELWGAGFFNFDQYSKESELYNGETFSILAEWAKKLNCYIHAGSVVEKEEEKLYNSSLLINPSGKLVAKYRKMHLFGYQSAETEVLTAGEEICTVETEYGVWGLTTCYDLRFPELYRKLVDKGADLFLIVAAWPKARLEHWKLFNQVRAVENQSYLLSCNCAGEHRKTRFAGHSMVVDPWGTPIAVAEDKEEVIWVDMDMEKVKENRAEFPALHDRKIFFNC